MRYLKVLSIVGLIAIGVLNAQEAGPSGLQRIEKVSIDTIKQLIKEYYKLSRLDLKKYRKLPVVVLGRFNKAVKLYHDIPNLVQRYVQNPASAAIISSIMQEVQHRYIQINLKPDILELTSKHPGLKNQIPRKNLIFLKEGRLVLGWCLTCPEAPLAERIAITLEVLLFAQENLSPAKPLVYTSFASGTLLQDYLIITQLIKLGFTNLTINLIDPSYHEGVTPQIEFFKSEIEKLLPNKLTLVSVTKGEKPVFNSINIYGNGYQYIDAYRANKKLASSLIIGVDLGQHPFVFIKNKNDNRELNHILVKKPRKRNLIMVIQKPQSALARIYASAPAANIAFRLYDELRTKTLEAVIENLVGEGYIIGRLERFVDPYLVLYEMILETLASNGKAFVLGHGIIGTFTKNSIQENVPLSPHERTGSSARVASGWNEFKLIRNN